MNSFHQNFALFSISLLCVVQSSCTSHSNPDQNNNIAATKQSGKKPLASFNDTLTILSPSAVFFSPDSLQLEKFKNISKQGVFESTNHDCYYQMRNAKMVLKQYWSRIKIIETSKVRYLHFIKKNKSEFIIDLNNKDICGIILFDALKDPELIDMTNVDTALGFYFTK